MVLKDYSLRTVSTNKLSSRAGQFASGSVISYPRDPVVPFSGTTGPEHGTYITVSPSSPYLIRFGTTGSPKGVLLDERRPSNASQP